MSTVSSVACERTTAFSPKVAANETCMRVAQTSTTPHIAKWALPQEQQEAGEDFKLIASMVFVEEKDIVCSQAPLCNDNQRITASISFNNNVC
jgi:hypothetical protein